MRSLHRLRVLRRSRNFNPLAILPVIQKAGQFAKAAENLQKVPQRISQIGEAAQNLTDANIAERLGQTTQELGKTARWIKYAAIGGLTVAGMAVLERIRR
ncbi:MAG: hypothetical protein MJE77_17505 [Proteobacteria bacterium]|nr:hypothetical protein [Pseudomonadota bacterium]